MKRAKLTWKYTDPSVIQKNQSGLLTFEQERLLRNQTPGAVQGVFYLIRVLPRLCILSLMCGTFISGQIGIPGSTAVLLIIFLLAVLPGMYFAYKGWIAREEVRYGKITRGEGLVEESWRGPTARAGDVKLRTIVGRLNLRTGRYRFYYFPKSLILLSAEPLARVGVSDSADLEQYILERMV